MNNEQLEKELLRQIEIEEEENQEIVAETKISKLLSERTTKVVIILVLIMLFFQPIFSQDTYQNQPTGVDQGLNYLRDIYDKNISWSLYQSTSKNLQAQLASDDTYPLIYLEIPSYSTSNYTVDPIIWQQAPYLTGLRKDEYAGSFSVSRNGQTFIAFYSTKYESQLTSVLSIIRTIFICAILSIASYFFTNDANTLVLNPIERMLEIVKLIAKNPLAAASDDVQKAGMLSLLEK